MSIMFHPKRGSIRVEILKLRLKSDKLNFTVTKLKLIKDKRAFELRNKERSLSEELYATKAEIELLTEQLEDLKDQVSETAYQCSRIEIHKTVEKSKIDSRIREMDVHQKGFTEMFDRARDLSELRNKEFKEKEAEELELERQKQMQMTERSEQQAREAASIEQECDAIERDCAVLKKRNKAIMLQLRRKLVDTEDIRRELMKKHDNPSN